MGVAKSPEVLKLEEQAREQGALELIASGVLKADLSPRQQRAYDDAVRFAAEIDAREREHYQQLPAQIAAENARVMTELNLGKLYLANRIGDAVVVHFASCPTVRHQVDRDLAHVNEVDPGSSLLGAWHAGTGYDPVAKWPNLMTLDEVEQLPKYRACQRCNPDTKARRKVAATPLKTSRLSSVTPDRLGREYETVAGDYLGHLESYTVSTDRITLHCSETDHHGPHDSLVVLLPKAR